MYFSPALARSSALYFTQLTAFLLFQFPDLPVDRGSPRPADRIVAPDRPQFGPQLRDLFCHGDPSLSSFCRLKMDRRAHRSPNRRPGVVRCRMARVPGLFIISAYLFHLKHLFFPFHNLTRLRTQRKLQFLFQQILISQ